MYIIQDHNCFQNLQKRFFFCTCWLTLSECLKLPLSIEESHDLCADIGLSTECLKFPLSIEESHDLCADIGLSAAILLCHLIVLLPWPNHILTYHLNVYVCIFSHQYIHSVGVIHRDLKPSNLAVNEDCELRVKYSVHFLHLIHYL